MAIFKIGMTVIYNGDKDENELSDQLWKAMQDIDGENGLAFLNVDSIRRMKKVGKDIVARIAAAKMKSDEIHSAK